MNDLERTDKDRRAALDEFANAAGQPNQPPPGGHTLVRPTASLTPVGAQPVAVHRDEGKIMQTLARNAAMAGSDWFYRFPVRSADGSQNWIEGPSIKLANDIARVYGNCIVETRELDYGDSWVFYARFSDLENGFSMERAYRQNKAQRSLKTKDLQRQQDIAYQIGQSKAIRNVIVNALQMFSDFAFEEARNSLVDKIGKDIESWRQRTIERLATLPVDLHRVERVLGRAAKDWLASDIARVLAMGKAVNDGMATIDETFPAAEVVEDKAAPVEKAAETATAPAAESPPGPETKVEQPKPTADPKTIPEYMALVAATCAAATDGNQLRDWFAHDVQRRLRNKLGMVAEDTAKARVLVADCIKELSSDV